MTEDEAMDEDIIEVDVRGKTVVRAYKTKNKLGYDLLKIRFSDGILLQVLEEGQTGYFSYKVIGP